MPRFLKQNRDTKDKFINITKKRSDQVRKEEQTVNELHRRKRIIGRRAEEEKARVKRRKKIQKEDELSKIELICESEDTLANATRTTPKQLEAARLVVLNQQPEARLHAKAYDYHRRGERRPRKTFSGK